jgi:O-antigen ligase
MEQVESRHIIATKIACRLTDQALPSHSDANNSHPYKLPQLAACVLMKFYLDLSYRDMEEWLSENDQVRQTLGLQRVPAHRTLQRTYKKLRDLDFEKMKNQILEEEQRQNHYLFWMKDRENHSGTDNHSWISRVMVIWLAGMVSLLPIKILNLPLNFELVDIWTLGGLPVVLYLYSLRQPRTISLSYTIPMWFVLISSLISAFASHSPTRSVIVIIKEVYLFVWFFVVLALLFQLSAKDIRGVLRVWSVVAICHGALMIAQFLSPDIWQFTNALGGNSARLEGYRAAGLFICDKAGCANKAAFFQLLGFVPLLLAGYSKRTTLILGLFLFAGMMTSGSMGATIASFSGLIVTLLVVAYLKKSLSLVLMNIVRLVVALFLLGGMFYLVASQNSKYQEHFRRIIIGRYEKSSGGRFDLWSRGIDVLLEHDAFFWGVGPENFRVVDASGNDNQLHNDTLAFLVERGLLGLIGLALFAGIAMIKIVQILQIFNKYPQRARYGVLVILAALVATMVESLTHQVFHTRELWLVLAVQEAVLYKMLTSEYGIEPAVSPVQEVSLYHPGLHVQPEISVNG